MARTSTKKQGTTRRSGKGTTRSTRASRTSRTTPDNPERAKIEAGGVSSGLMAFLHSRFGRGCLILAGMALLILLTLVLTRHNMKHFYTAVGAEIIVGWAALTLYSLHQRR